MHSSLARMHYNYLGLNIDATLNLSTQFDKNYKQATNQIRLLSRFRSQLTTQASKSIYSSLIIPSLTYCSLLYLNFTPTQLKRLNSIRMRSRRIIKWNTNDTVNLPPIENLFYFRACSFVKSCLTKNSHILFNNYFTLINHGNNTRNNSCLLRLPKIRLEYAKRSVSFAAARMFNNLPTSIRRNYDKNTFDTQLRLHFEL